MTHKLPPLPYDYSALEPHIDTRTMTFIVILIAVVLVLLAVSIHLGMLHSMKALMPRQ